MIDIVYIGNRDYAAAIRVSAASALRRAADPRAVRVHVVTDDPGFPDIGFDVRRWKGSGRADWHGTELVWSRLDFAELFPECDWVVSCDGDTLWMADPAALWALRDDRLALLASRDVPPASGAAFPHYAWWGREGLVMPPDKCYCCGLMLLNLKKMRAERYAGGCARFLREHPDPPLREQTVLCYLARHASAPLPPEWGVFSFWHTDVPDPKLVHYVQDLPWRRRKANRLMSDIVLKWWEECERLGLSSSFPGFRGCRCRLDYLWRRLAFVALRPFAGVIDRIPWLKPRFRNVRGLRR